MRTIKIFVTLVLAVGVSLSVVFLPKTLLFYGGENYTFFVGDTSKSCKVITTATPTITKLTLNNISGESAYYPTLDVEAFIADIGGEVVFCEQLSDSTNYYCSAPLPYSVTLYGKEINLHICVKNSGVIVASPIIFGGY
jgi:hypothetical protein